MPSVDSNDKSMSNEDSEDEERQEESSFHRLERHEEGEYRETPLQLPQQCETNILPEVIQVDVNESEETLESDVVRPAVSNDVQMEGQPTRLRVLHQSALSLTERIEQETRRLRKAGMLYEMKERALASAGKQTPTQGIGDSAFRSEALPGELTCNIDCVILSVTSEEVSAVNYIVAACAQWYSGDQTCVYVRKTLANVRTCCVTPHA